ncbi:tautomerase family protein [Aquabacterium sp. A7-Y]|uniref:tautomerase family protein n=1 Tax=Aquabacterium sp. A7-Y TaxID=1349605 RepID=UPI00223DF97C|nr:tautomerase family protein [Aquabacterium sp. A7-Y]MCW7537968.1 tautomerase family protein [Aquabacterium sp. A7-Y]
MPLARLSVPVHLGDERVQGLADAVHHGLVDTCHVPLEDRFQLIIRMPAGSMILDPYFGGVVRGEEACVVEILLLRGRTESQKRQLYRAIADRAMTAGFRPDDVLISLTENSAIDWSLGRGEAFEGLGAQHMDSGGS